jgi:hypothetical protein
MTPDDRLGAGIFLFSALLLSEDVLGFSRSSPVDSDVGAGESGVIGGRLSESFGHSLTSTVVSHCVDFGFVSSGVHSPEDCGVVGVSEVSSVADEFDSSETTFVSSWCCSLSVFVGSARLSD